MSGGLPISIETQVHEAGASAVTKGDAFAVSVPAGVAEKSQAAAILAPFEPITGGSPNLL
jgi:hypothetical protein